MAGAGRLMDDTRWQGIARKHRGIGRGAEDRTLVSRSGSLLRQQLSVLGYPAGRFLLGCLDEGGQFIEREVPQAKLRGNCRRSTRAPGRCLSSSLPPPRHLGCGAVDGRLVPSEVSWHREHLAADVTLQVLGLGHCRSPVVSCSPVRGAIVGSCFAIASGSGRESASKTVSLRLKHGRSGIPFAPSPPRLTLQQERAVDLLDELLWQVQDDLACTAATSPRKHVASSEGARRPAMPRVSWGRLSLRPGDATLSGYELSLLRQPEPTLVAQGKHRRLQSRTQARDQTRGPAR
jgi:hypothetical protein